MTLWEILKANKTGIAPDMFTMLAASKMNGGRDRLHELSGIPPLSFTAKGKPLTAWSITGNTVQNGTPTPENPVEVVGVGDRTGNLFDKDKQAGIIYVTETDTRYGVEIPVSAGTYSIVGGTNKLFVKKKQGTTYGTVMDTSAQRTITLPQNGYILIYAERIEDYTVSNVMLNLGSTSLPYEPYGYKIPVVTRGKNLFDKENASPQAVTNKGVFVNNSSYISSNYISVSPNTTYTKIPVIKSGQFHDLCEYDENKIFIRHIFTANNGTFATSEKTKYIVFNIAKFNIDIAQLEKGSTATPYEPYHEPITTPIYLPTPLYSGEVMSSDGTITRSDGTTETFTAPQIPTLNGTTIIDVDTAVKPESMTIKYRR